MHIALPFTDLINRPKYLIEIFMNQEDLQKLKDTNSCPTGDFEGLFYLVWICGEPISVEQP